MKDILNFIKNHKVYIYGNGMAGQTFLEYLRLRNLEENVQGFVVSALKDNKAVCLDKTVLEVSKLKDQDPHAAIIVCVTEQFRREIINTLRKYEFDNYEILQDWQITECVRMKPRKKLVYQVHIAEHCNLNCRGCFHCSPLADKEFMDLKAYERDVKRLSYLFNGEAEWIQLLGGEPLLHPDIIGFFKVTRENFPEAKIELITNGICLPKMSEEFYLASKKYNITFRPTEYPINVDYDAIKKKAEAYGIPFSFFVMDQDEEGNKILENYHFDIDGRQSAEDNFYKCYRSNLCIALHHGKMYSCVVGANIYHFKNYFGLNQIEISEDNGIDIYNAKSADEITEFLVRPMPVCKYCKVEDKKTMVPFELSKKDMNEWL